MSNTIENGLIAAILFLIIFIPVYLAVRSSRNKKKRRITHELHLLEQQHGLTFRVIDKLDSFAIVIDQLKKVIIKVNLLDYSSELIDLKNISDCTIDEKRQGSSIQLLQLVLWDKNKHPIHYITFYKQYVDNEGNLKKATRIAAQWEEMIKASINNRLPVLEVQKSI
ncbi:hypothetical protein [Mucilaginibacter flavidus]|uniref:hypothetical protein n=1 Tax=Mucilaginibacter flavidus TaxID=2949309 RepID=UPI00209346F7|nr:hypothetical protein [Mucilaginibacter flavidus]MCO5950267.1 hypothetical protein [Mucilaginibacter flavidus]